MTITEVSKKYGVSADTLRYYERIGLLPPVPRSRGGVRNYDEDACRWVELMLCMRKAGVQIDVLIRYVTLFRQGEQTAPVRKAILLEQRERLLARMEDLRQSLERLNQKIALYDGLETPDGEPAAEKPA